MPLQAGERMAHDKSAVRKILDQAKAAGRSALTAPEAKGIAEAYGIAVPKEGVASTAAEAAKLATRIGYPVVMKIVSPQILHKTEAGGVVVGVKSAESAQQAFATIVDNARRYNARAAIDGVQIQQMLSSGQEVIIGAVTDPAFGKLVAFGLGGILVEVLKDITFRLAPATREEALSMLDGIAAAEILRGARGGPPVDREALATMIVSVSQLVADFPEVSELDLNPVFATARGATAADVRVVLDFKPPVARYRPSQEVIVRQMNRIMRPDAVAVIGASAENGKIGNSVMKNLINGGYQGAIYPVHPSAAEILGKKAYKSVKDVPANVDVAVFAIPAKFVDQRLGDELGGNGEHRHVDVCGHVLDALVGLLAEDLGGAGVDRIDRALVAAIDEILHDRVADLAVLGRGADHRHRIGPHDAVHLPHDDFLARTVARHGRLEIEHHAHVGCGGAARGGEHGIQVELGHLREVRHELRDADDHRGERLAVHGRRAAGAAQDFRSRDAIEHRQGFLARRRREPEGDVLQHLDQDAAETESDQLAEGGIGDGADDHLLAAGEHLLDLHPVDRRFRVVAARIGDDGGEGFLGRFGAPDADHDAAGLGLVQDLR